MDSAVILAGVRGLALGRVARVVLQVVLALGDVRGAPDRAVLLGVVLRGAVVLAVGQLARGSGRKGCVCVWQRCRCCGLRCGRRGRSCR
eukprot:8778564-Alexandrium_andersonii.AAC.1